MAGPRNTHRRWTRAFTIDADLSEWLDEKNTNVSNLVNTAIREMMTKEKKNQVPFIKKQLDEIENKRIELILEKEKLEKSLREILAKQIEEETKLDNLIGEVNVQQKENSR